MEESVYLKNSRWSSHTEMSIPSKRHGDNRPIVTRFGVWVCFDTVMITVESIDGKKQDVQAIYKSPFHQSGTVIQICVWVCFDTGMVVVASVYLKIEDGQAIQKIPFHQSGMEIIVQSLPNLVHR